MKPHHCRYSVVGGSRREEGEVFRWMERCRCGRQVWIKTKWNVIDGKVDPYVEKQWFTPDGKLEKQTTQGEIESES